jgi:diguanylate cyclase (GGDEF)-like protein/PAS domain S-box-containing protein
MLREQFAPMLTASRSMEAQAASDRLLEPLPVTSQDEIGELIGGFNRLLEALRKRDEELRESHIKLQSVLDHSPALISIKDLQGVVLIANRQFSLLDAPPLNELIGRSVFDIFPKDVAQALWENDQAAVRADSTIEVEEVVSHKDGTLHTYLTLKFPVRDSVGEVFGTCAISTDITERKHAEAKLKLAASVFSHAREGITITDAAGNIIDVNATFSDITGYSREDVIGQNPRILRSGRQGPEFYADLWRSLEVKGHWYGEIWNRRKNGEVYAEMLTISAVRDPHGVTQNYVALFSDITAIKAHQSQLEHIAHFDALTNLPNRLLLADRLQQAMAQAQRRGQQLAVVYLDLDEFKGVNDRHGHDVGDQLLIHLATAMKDTLREGDTLARIGGDEFVAVLTDLDGIENCVPMLTRLLGAASAPVQFGAVALQGSASIGVTFYPQANEMEADQLLRQADQAMYQAKLAGKNRYHVFDSDYDSSMRVHHESLEHIRQALERREFVLHYQPKVNMRSGQVMGAEALIRWQHPEKGLLAPATFLPVIEDHPLAVEVGEWVIDTALTQIEVWHTAGLDLPVSVNIGARQLQQGNFMERLQAIMAQHPQVNPSSLELEVLETSALADMEQVSQVIEACHKIGVKFALDDFGTGYSSLTYLKRLRVTLLKIDQSFVRDMLEDPDDLAILQGVIGLAAAFKREVIAEGVETVAHGTALLHLGCELAQGYGIARPMPPEQLPAWAATWQPDAAWCAVPYG